MNSPLERIEALPGALPELVREAFKNRPDEVEGFLNQIEGVLTEIPEENHGSFAEEISIQYRTLSALINKGTES